MVSGCGPGCTRSSGPCAAHFYGQPNARKPSQAWLCWPSGASLLCVGTVPYVADQGSMLEADEASSGMHDWHKQYSLQHLQTSLALCMEQGWAGGP